MMVSSKFLQRSFTWVCLGVLSFLIVIGSATILQARNFGSVQLLMGAPSPATKDPSNKNDFLITRRQYALSYNNDKGTPNWVSWQLNASWLGSVDRCGGFSPDPLLPKDFNIVKPNDYTGSGFSRGHMTRSGDRTANTTDNCATFFLTNIVPQTQEQNEGPWLELENLSKELAQSGKELYIVAGPLGEGGTGLKGAMTRIKGKITVPESTWKIVLVLDKPGLGVKGVTTKTRVIAVRMPNTLGIQSDSYKKYLTTVDELEKLTGYDFLSDVPVGVQAVIEAKKDS
ncbi:MAG: DNA/RNA non-specific endonuclease [Phormidesmis sp. CAN_BIN44]|nr:DNA/RNA non-specific endonuclease [Phormidesmis sp. CAN_BIN44]